MSGNSLAWKKGLPLDWNIERFFMKNPETLLDPHDRGRSRDGGRAPLCEFSGPQRTRT